VPPHLRERLMLCGWNGEDAATANPMAAASS
jgi:hypothetical protein